MWKLSLLLSIIILTSTANSVEVTTDNLLNNSTFGIGTTYSNENWTITSEDYHNNTSLGGGNNPGGSVATDNATNIEQTISSLSSAAEMTVNEIRRGFSSKLSADIWYWNQYDNTTTLKQTITDNEGNVTTQQRIIADTGCGGINCGSYTNYTDTHIQGSNTKDDFSIKVNVSNTNNRGSSHYGPDIDDIELKVTYTDVPPIEEDVEEELEDIAEDIVDVVEDIEDDIEWEEDLTWEDDFTWEDEYFEEEFDMVWEDYGVEFNDEIYFEEEFIEFEEEFDTTVTMEEDFFEMEMEEEWVMTEDYEMTEMDTFFTEMSEDEWEERDTMSDEEFEEFLEEEFPEEFAEMQEEPMEMEETVEMEEEMVFNEEETMEPPEEMIEEEETEEMEVVEDDSESTEETAEAVEEEPESEESPQEVATDEDEADGEESIASDESIEAEEEKAVAVKKEKIETVKEKIKAKIEAIKINEIKVAEVKPTLFSNQPDLEEYSNVNFYAPVELNYEVNDAFFEQMSLDMYNQQIYGDATLANYTQNDVVEVHRRKLEEISMKKRALMIELEQLRGN